MITFYSDNLVDQAVITSSTENLNFPLDNLKDHRRSKVFRSTTNSDEVVFDFQETSEIDSVFFVDSKRYGFGFSTATIEGNAINDWTSPIFSESLSIDIKHGVGKNEFDIQSARFARLSLTSTLGYCELSKLFIGKKLKLLNNRGINFGWTFKDEDMSTSKENSYGQRFSDKKTRRRHFNFSFNLLTKDQLDQIFSILDSKGTTAPFYISIGCPDMTNSIERYSAMVFLKDDPPITNNYFNRYSLSFDVVEAM